MAKCAFLTLSDPKGWFIDDDLVHEPLKSLGWEVENVPWDQPTNWSNFDLVILRSTWDYYNYLEAFIKVLAEIERSTATLLNPIDLVKWNLNKNYLFELGQIGVEIVPSIRFSGLEEINLNSAFEEFESGELILKPLVGASAVDTFRVSRNTELDPIIKLFAQREGLIQPFMNQILEEGEYSLMYFNGVLSHIILKTAGEGDYRIQQEHGGDVSPVENPESALVTAADRIIEALPDKLLYARVDLIRASQDSFALMELELVEPSMYLTYGKGSELKFASAIDAVWKNSIT